MPPSINEDHPPISVGMLGRLYRASPQGLAALIKTVPPETLAALAVYCYGRVHLRELGLEIAAACQSHDMQCQAGQFG